MYADMVGSLHVCLPSKLRSTSPVGAGLLSLDSSVGCSKASLLVSKEHSVTPLTNLSYSTVLAFKQETSGVKPRTR